MGGGRKNTFATACGGMVDSKKKAVAQRIEIGTHRSYSKLSKETANFYASIFLMNYKFKHKAENLQA